MSSLPGEPLVPFVTRLTERRHPLSNDIDNVLPQRLGEYPKLGDIEPSLANFYLAHETLRTPEPLRQLDLREAGFLAQAAQQCQ